MPKHSFRSEPWTDFSKESDRIFEEDFVKNSILTVKTSHQPSRGIVKFKEHVTLKNNRYTMDEEVRIWFPFGNLGSSLYTQILNNEGKIRYDHGVREYGNNLINFYGGAQTQKNFNNTILKIGAHLLLVNTSFNTRLRLVFKDKATPQICTGHKFNWTTDKWTFDACGIVKYNNYSIVSTSYRIIHNISKNQQAILKAQNNIQRPINQLHHINHTLGGLKFTADYVQKFDKDTKAGISVKFDKSGLLNSCVVGERAINKLGSKVKVKLCSSRMISLSYQSEIRNYGRWVIGWEVSDLGSKNNSKFGLLVDLNL